MNILINSLSQTLLWEIVSITIEETAKPSEILKDIGYIDHDVFKEIKKTEIFDSEEIIIRSVTPKDNSYFITFQMPVILMFYNSKEQILRVTTTVIGSCCISDEHHFDWCQLDFESMNKVELLSYRDLIENIQCAYFDVECDDLRMV